ncbi:hypothetical protein ASG31_14880 [Chryseobacterium sp. Leaf404]|uniref:hypothetical protein n=1 Tax=unclassified Chryseobacterium TaxID=2593645 RepID=UPI0006F4C8B5|nr:MULTISPECIES: hypothetical protein [unclassified Chryseobacterium]KQT15542.1 hypothetical protein ASG31_14880 [Chryseobacterium sp. Leaf404]
MKKLITAVFLIIGLGIAQAQQVAPVTKAAPKTTKTVKTVEAKPSAKPAAKLKKDGTPDRRYKENQKLKKDGTPDKRFKVNK